MAADSASPAPVGSPAGPPSRPSGLGHIAAAALGAALFIDAAVETFVAGSAVRWWTAGAAVLYLAATAATWRVRAGWRGRLAAGILGLLALVAATAWGPAGLTDGIHVFGQPTAVVLAVLAAAGVALAGVALVQADRLPLAARIGAGVIAAYGVGAFVLGAIDRTPLAALLAGQSLWQQLPFVLQGAFVGAFVVLPIGLAWTIVQAGLRRPPNTSRLASLWRIVALATSLAMVLAGLPLGSGDGGAAAPSLPAQAETLAAAAGIDPNAPPPTPEAINTALANSLRAVADGDRDMPQDHWDVGYVARHLGSDTAREFRWVQQHTFWIPYRGTLRGPVGVLMDRLGDSLDRALLLAAMIQQSGRAVRLAHATLPPDRASTLLMARYADRVGARRAAVAPSDPIAQIAASYSLDEKAVRRTLSTQAALRVRQRARTLQRVADQAKRLSAAVGTPGTAAAAASIDAALDAAADHWWTQTLEGGTWHDLDLDGGPSGAPLGSLDGTLDPGALPDNLRHQITVRVITEQWANGTLSERTAIERTLRPADLIGTPVMLHFAPADWPADFPPPNMDPTQGFRQVELGQHAWTLTLTTGTNAVAQMNVTEAGDVVAPKAGSAGGAYSHFGNALEDALGKSSEPVAPKTAPASDKVLTAASIEYEIQTPGQPPQKIRRTVFDLVGPAARAARPVARPRIDDATRLRRSLALTMETEILPEVCRFVPQFVTHLTAESLLANKDVLTAAVRGDLPSDYAHAQEVWKKLTPMPTSLYGLALARFVWSRHPASIYIDRPNILTRHLFFAPTGKRVTLFTATDIVANQIGVDPAQADPFSVRLEQGVLDTNAEAFLASDRPTASNAGWAYATSSDWSTLKSANDLGSIRLSDEARQQIARDLSAGFVVVAPRAPVPVASGRFEGWWRVDPRTGQSLGMGTSGWGQDMVEYLVLLATSMGLAFVFQYLWCTMSNAGASPDVASACQPARSRDRPSLLNSFVTPVHAAGSECLRQAVIAALFAGMLASFIYAAAGASVAGALGAAGAGVAGESAAAGEAAGEAAGQAAGAGEGAASGEAAGQASGAGEGAASGQAAGGRASPTAPTQPAYGDPTVDPYRDTVPGDPFADEPGNPAGDTAPTGGSNPQLDQAWERLEQAKQNLSDFGARAKEAGARGLLNSPQYQQLYREWAQAMNHLIDNFGPEPPIGGAAPGPGGASPPSPTAPTLPGTGPGGTQVIPPTGTNPTQPQLNCAGTPCVSPYADTQTGLGGVLNALGQSSPKGGGS
jgi:hypothetical protein